MSCHRHLCGRKSISLQPCGQYCDFSPIISRQITQTDPMYSTCSINIVRVISRQSRGRLVTTLTCALRVKLRHYYRRQLSTGCLFRWIPRSVYCMLQLGLFQYSCITILPIPLIPYYMYLFVWKTLKRHVLLLIYYVAWSWSYLIKYKWLE